jgi:DNA-binding MarR family transcriptional regulator
VHDDTEDPEDLDASQLLPLLARRLRHQRSAELERFGLTPAQARAFAVINRALDHGQEVRLSTLAERLRIAPRSATEVVDALEEKGLVRRTPSPGDRRAVAVEVTPVGAELRDEMRRVLGAARRARADDLFSTLDDDEREHLTVLLRRLVVAAEEQDPER